MSKTSDELLPTKTTTTTRRWLYYWRDRRPAPLVEYGREDADMYDDGAELLWSRGGGNQGRGNRSAHLFKRSNRFFLWEEEGKEKRKGRDCAVDWIRSILMKISNVEETDPMRGRESVYLSLGVTGHDGPYDQPTGVGTFD
jgi:hypothetical protein